MTRESQGTETESDDHSFNKSRDTMIKYYYSRLIELKWSAGRSTGPVDWLSASERGQYLDGCPAMNTKC